MPDHIHLVHFAEPEWTYLCFMRLVAAFARFRGGVRGWSVPVPEPIARDKLWRQLRYVHLNPCRAGLARDPLSWPFSTHRDSVGATYNPWLRLDELPVRTEEASAVLRRRFHAYVSSDPSVSSEGTAFPSPAPPVGQASFGLEQIRQAVASASPWCPVASRRERIVMLARLQGWTTSKHVAQAANLARRQVQRIWQRENTLDLAPAALCLGDARLRAGAEAPQMSPAAPFQRSQRR